MASAVGAAAGPPAPVTPPAPPGPPVTPPPGPPGPPPASPPASPIPGTNLNAFSTGILGIKFKKGNTWNVAPAGSNIRKLGLNTERKITKKAPLYRTIQYTNYKLDEIKKNGFPSEDLSLLGDNYKNKNKMARIYSDTVPGLDKMESEFQKAVNTFRTAQLKPELDKKKAANKKEWNNMTKDLSIKTKAELDAMTQEYRKKKAELEKQLEAAFKVQREHFIINKQWETKGKYNEYLTTTRSFKPGVKDPSSKVETLNSLKDVLEITGRPIINSVKVGTTRRKHRFLHFLRPRGAPTRRGSDNVELGAESPVSSSAAAAAAALRRGGIPSPVSEAGSASPASKAGSASPASEAGSAPSHSEAGSASPAPRSPIAPIRIPVSSQSGGKRKTKRKRGSRR